MRPLTVFACGSPTKPIILVLVNPDSGSWSAIDTALWFTKYFGKGRIELCVRPEELITALLRQNKTVLVDGLFTPVIWSEIETIARSLKPHQLIIICTGLHFPVSLVPLVNIVLINWPDAIDIWRMIEQQAPILARQEGTLENFIAGQLCSRLTQFGEGTIYDLLQASQGGHSLLALTENPRFLAQRLPPLPLRFEECWIPERQPLLVPGEILRVIQSSSPQTSSIFGLWGDSTKIDLILDGVTHWASRVALPKRRVLLLLIDLGLVPPYSWANLLGMVAGSTAVVVAIKGVRDFEIAKALDRYLTHVRSIVAIFFVGENPESFTGWGIPIVEIS